MEVGLVEKFDQVFGVGKGGGGGGDFKLSNDNRNNTVLGDNPHQHDDDIAGQLLG